MFGTEWMRRYRVMREEVGDLGDKILSDEFTFGIIPRILAELYDVTKRSPAILRIRCSFFQIYNEKIYDLFKVGKMISKFL